MLVRFIAEIEPCAKGRARIGRTRRDKVVAFTPEKTRRWESNFAAIAVDHKPRAIIDEPLFLSLLFLMRRPKELCTKSAPPGRIHHTKRPDLDNLEKAVMDAFKSWWRDDSIVVAKSSNKMYAALDESPCIHVVMHSVSLAYEANMQLADELLGGDR